MTQYPELTIKPMNRFQSRVLRLVSWLIGIKGDAYVCFIEYSEAAPTPTINDIIKNNQEDEANRVSTNNN